MSDYNKKTTQPQICSACGVDKAVLKDFITHYHNFQNDFPTMKLSKAIGETRQATYLRANRLKGKTK